MTIHMFYDHQCPKCQTKYVPYAVNIPCPTCGNVEEQVFEEFIPRAVESCRFNLTETRSYVPVCWSMCGFADEVLYYIFGILEDYRTSPKEKTFSVLVDESITKGNLGYLRDQMYDMVVRVHEELERGEDKNENH